MVGQNRAALIAQIGAWSTPKITEGKSIDFAGAVDAWNKGRQLKEQREKEQLNNERRDAYINAINGGNQEEIDKAFANYDPEAYARVMASRQDADTQFARQKELAQMNFGNQLALENLRNKNAIGLKQLESALKAGQNDTESLSNAQNAVNTLSRIAQNGNIGAMTRLRQGFGMASDQQERELGEISGAIAAIAPRAIAKLKAAGVSGVNTLGEFMTYVGLPQNATSKQIAGALPLIAQVAGVSLPEQQASPADIVTSSPSMTSLDVGATQKYNNGFSVTRIK